MAKKNEFETRKPKQDFTKKIGDSENGLGNEKPTPKNNKPKNRTHSNASNRPSVFSRSSIWFE
jgi:hypothetical protein